MVQIIGQQDLLDIGQEVDDVHVGQVFLEGNSSCTPTIFGHKLLWLAQDAIATVYFGQL